MKKAVLSIEQVMKAKYAIDQILQFPGIPNKKVHWLNRNREHLLPYVKKWIKKLSEEIQPKYTVELAPDPIIPWDNYQPFKKELLAGMKEESRKNPDEKVLVINEICFFDLLKKYEYIPKVSKGIPKEKMEEYNNEAKEAALKEDIDFEFYEIVKSKEIVNVLQQLSGEMQLALEFMFEEPSPIHLVNDGIEI